MRGGRFTKTARVSTCMNGVAVLAAAALFLAAAVPPPDAPVADAAMRGDVEQVRSLLRSGADVNAAQGDGMTALHWAARNGSAELAEVLTYAGADPEAVTRIGHYTPLHLASRAGHAEVVEVLLEAGSDPNARTTTGGATPLHFAAGVGSPRTVTVLLDHGAVVDARGSAWNSTPLMWVAAQGHVSTADVLLARGADVSTTSEVVDVPARAEAADAAQERRDKRLATLRAFDAEPTQAGTGEDNGAGAEVDADNDREEPTAEEQTDEEESDEPVEEDEDEPERLSYDDLVGNKGGLTPLHFAARQGHVEMARALLDGGSDIDQVTAGDHTSPLLIATVNGHFDLAMELLARGADPNLASDAGTTPLYAAINVQWSPQAAYPQPNAHKQQQATYLQYMEALLEAGADPNVRLNKHLWYMEYNFPRLNVDTRGATPLWRAAFATDVAAMRLLVQYGADANIPTRRPPERSNYDGTDPDLATDPSGLPPVPVGGPGIYPIHAATGVGYGAGYGANAHRHAPDGWLPSVRYLVEELGVDINARDYNGYNAVHHAASRGDTDLIYYLVEQGADVTAVSRDGQTTADMANGPVQRTQPYPEAVDLLESLGSKNNHNCVSC